LIILLRVHLKDSLTAKIFRDPHSRGLSPIPRIRLLPAANWVKVTKLLVGKLLNMEEETSQPKRGILRNKSEDKHQ